MTTKQAAPKAIRFREDQLIKLRELGRVEDRSLHWQVIKAVDRYLEEHYKK
jgi:hypothetical protein